MEREQIINKIKYLDQVIYNPSRVKEVMKLIQENASNDIEIARAFFTAISNYLERSLPIPVSKCFSSDVLNNEDLFLNLIKSVRNGSVLFYYAGENLKKDPSFLLNCIKISGITASKVFEFGPKEIIDDFAFVCMAVKVREECVRYINAKYRKSAKHLAELIERNPKILTNPNACIYLDVAVLEEVRDILERKAEISYDITKDIYFAIDTIQKHKAKTKEKAPRKVGPAVRAKSSDIEPESLVRAPDGTQYLAGHVGDSAFIRN